MKTALFTLAVVGLTTVSAQAALTVMDTDTFDFPLSPGATTVELNQFDDNGGLHELCKVTIEITGTISADVTAENNSQIPGDMGVNLTGFVNIIGHGLDATANIFLVTPTVAVTATDNGGIPNGMGTDFNDFGTVSDTDSDDDMLTTGLAAFVGGGTLLFDVAGSGGFSITGVTDSTQDVSNFGASGTAKVTYEYKIVPEPASMALLGLGGLAVLRRRK